MTAPTASTEPERRVAEYQRNRRRLADWKQRKRAHDATQRTPKATEAAS